MYVWPIGAFVVITGMFYYFNYYLFMLTYLVA